MAAASLIGKVLLKRPSIFHDIGYCLASFSERIAAGKQAKEILLSDGEGANFFAIWPELLPLPLSLFGILQSCPFDVDLFYHMLFDRHFTDNKTLTYNIQGSYCVVKSC